MKLEFKHIAAYLPYNLQVIIYSENEPKITNIDGLSLNPDEMVFLQDDEDFYINSEYNEFSFKPILRPLSDMTKEIEINEEVLNPTAIIVSDYITNTKGRMFNGDLYDINYDNIMLLPYFTIGKLLEFHFDVFGLIENGLAVDINSL